MIKTLKAMAIGLPIVAAALVAAPGTANAALNECPTDRFCAWINDEFSGSMASWSGNSSNWGTMGDNAESMYNRRASSATRVDNVVTYHDVNYGDRGVCVNPGETYDTGMWDNSYSSHEWVHSC
ncbi:peptidase inhibitor family I36 protein [Actinomadura sp. HBU206391]|uniref:peptidase inhibitor family I36 protein n=1 Tax=Actinomadura sp. HBU206391 TaxID=2731692 RepID=UPI00164FE7FF|nr:peptidase inhibitor family I36 protein [Actinomadura sp. HBU206391]MBC6462463.1 peptidase inhibitor family I36 protein [Actinomadura sp. HBU206391]